jgi:hypothetical protein
MDEAMDEVPGYLFCVSFPPLSQLGFVCVAFAFVAGNDRRGFRQRLHGL